MLSELDKKQVDRLYALLEKTEGKDPDTAASLRWAIFTLEQQDRQQSSADPLLQLAFKPQSEINGLMDTGLFNEIVKGYMVIAMQATGANHEGIQKAVSALDDIFDDTDAAAARSAYRKL